MDQPTLTDDEIVAAVIAGRRQDYEILIRRYSGKIIHFITHMTQDRDEAQSISQEVFLKIFLNLPYYRQENNFSAFIFKIAKNMTLNWLNREKRTVFFSRLLGREFHRQPFRQDPPPAALERNEREAGITRNLLLLPEEQRLALVLKVYLEFSYKQIREITGWSIPKIETLISRAKSRLKKNIYLQEKGLEFVSPAREK